MFCGSFYIMASMVKGVPLPDDPNADADSSNEMRLSKPLGPQSLSGVAHCKQSLPLVDSAENPALPVLACDRSDRQC